MLLPNTPSLRLSPPRPGANLESLPRQCTINKQGVNR